MESKAAPPLALLGHPVEHSLSPLIHNAAFRALGMEGRYVACDVAPANLEAALQGLVSLGFRGANVTIPHKESVMPFLAAVSPEARAIGAVNTLLVEDGRLLGENTDHLGFLDPLGPLMDRLSGGHAVVLGAGGAARGVLFALVRSTALARITVLSRRRRQAQAMVDAVLAAVAHDGSRVRVGRWESADEESRKARLVVNTTPLGMTPHTDASPLGAEALHSGQIVYDLIYSPSTTLLLSRARSAGAVVIGGLPMLIGQAAAAFRLWTGVDMPLDPVRQALSQYSP